MSSRLVLPLGSAEREDWSVVVDEGVDTGPIIAQSVVPVEDDDDVESLHERIKVAERQMLVDTVGRIARQGFSINDRKVRIG